MIVPAKKNAIEKRLDVIEDLWNGFAQQPGAKLCRWLVTAAEARLIEAFVEYQNEEASDVPDLFLRFDEPFESSKQHGFVLREALARKYEEVRLPLREEGIEADWSCPPLAPDEGDMTAFVRALASFREYCGTRMEHVAVALLPTRVEDGKAWADWVQRLLKGELPVGVRILVTDPVEGPALSKLAEAEPELVHTIQPDLNLPAAYLDLARGDGRINPGVLFRLNFLALTQAAGTGNMAKVQELAANALSIAQKHGWPTMESVVQMAVASACLAGKDVAGALAAYKTAGAAANAAAKNGDPAGPKMILHAKLAEGSALVSGNRHQEAASVYEEAGQMAAQLSDPFLCMESWRMAAHCHEQLKAVEPSWRCGNLALDAAEKLKPEDRAKSPLPYVGQGMLRVIGRGNRDLSQHVQQRMTTLLGPDWQRSLEGGVKPA